MLTKSSRGDRSGQLLVAWAAAVAAVVITGPALHGQSLSRYRDFVLGGTVSSVTGTLGVPATEVKLIHERPARLEDLQWRTPYFMSGTNAVQTDSVQQIAFSFYNDQLFRIVIDYDRQRTEGMTDADMIAALSEMYGASAKPRVKTGPVFNSRIDVDSGAPLARWGDAGADVGLFRASIGSGYQVVVTSLALDRLARAADAQAVRLDAREAPVRELARQKKDAEDIRLTQEKARATNKSVFRP